MVEASSNGAIGDGVDAAPTPVATEWIKPEVTKLDLETAQQTGIPS